MNLQTLTLQSNAASKLMATSLERMGSGKKINSAADNAAGVAILERLEAQGKAFNASIANANNGISLLNTADSAASGVQDGLQRLRELAVQSANGILSDQDRDTIQAESSQIQSEISRITQDTEFNGRNLLATEDSLNIQLGADGSRNASISTPNLTKTLNGQGLGAIDLGSQASSQSALSNIDAMLDSTSQVRSGFGAQANRLVSSVANLTDQSISTAQSRSRIEDTDYAIESANFAAANIKEQVGFAVQAQANANAGQVLSLLSA